MVWKLYTMYYVWQEKNSAMEGTMKKIVHGINIFIQTKNMNEGIEGLMRLCMWMGTKTVSHVISAIYVLCRHIG